MDVAIKPRLKKAKFAPSAEDVYVSGVDLLPDDLPPYVVYEPEDYKDGPEGFIKWCYDNVALPIYREGQDIATWCPIKDLPTDVNPKTGRAYCDIWEGQKEEIRKCLRMINGRFIYRLLVFCWPRGEGKSLLACLIQLWKFFNWTRQQIVLGANSKEQTTFVHFDVMRDIILNSPNLHRSVGPKNILEKAIRLRDARGRIVNVIRAISSFTGVVSNITGYTFSEMFDMKNPKFFVQLDGSIRNIPNALGVIDSTVSDRQHVLYNLFQSFVKRSSKTLYFSYRFSKKGIMEDYWNPNMTQDQLNDYREKFPLGEFERYFLNLWSAGSDMLFTDAQMEACNYLGFDGGVKPNKMILELVERKKDAEQVIEDFRIKGLKLQDINSYHEAKAIAERFYPVSAVYTMSTKTGMPQMATIDALSKLGDMYDTDWLLMAGIDRADPLKGTRLGARTIFSCIAKGLAGSRSNPFLRTDETSIPRYIYFLLHIVNVESHSLEDLKKEIMACHEEFDGLDVMCGERWGTWDIVPWCEENDISYEPIFPTYDRQKGAFSEFYLAVSTGRFKTPQIFVPGSKKDDILKEEASIFSHDPDKHWFGSPEKNEKYGIQDDAMFSIAWCMHAGREKTIDDFRARNSVRWFGSFTPDRNTAGKYE